MSFPSLASINAAYDFLMSGKADKRRHHLKKLVGYCHNKLKRLSHELQPTVTTLQVPEGHPSSSPIIPLFTSHPKSLSQHCQRSGFMVRPIVAPTVPLGQERIRICLHATNTTEQIDSLCRVIEMWMRNHIEQGGKSQIPVMTLVQDDRLNNDKAKL